MVYRITENDVKRMVMEVAKQVLFENKKSQDHLLKTKTIAGAVAKYLQDSGAELNPKKVNMMQQQMGMPPMGMPQTPGAMPPMGIPQAPGATPPMGMPQAPGAMPPMGMPQAPGAMPPPPPAGGDL